MATNVSGVTNHFPKPQDGFTTTTSGPVSSGAATVGLNSTGNYSDGDIFVGIIDPGDATKKQAFTGVMDVGGSQVTGVKWTSGTNQAHSSGATVVDYVAATHLAMMTKGILVSHNQDGTVKNGAVSSSGMLGNNVVTEAKVLDGAITTGKLADDAVTDAKLVYGKVRSRQGGSATDWSVAGTTTYDTSATNTFEQAGSLSISGTSGTESTLTFPTAFASGCKPLVYVSTASANGANVTFSSNTPTNTNVKVRILFSGGGSATETVNWRAVGE